MQWPDYGGRRQHFRRALLIGFSKSYKPHTNERDVPTLGTIHKRRCHFFRIFDTPFPMSAVFLVLSICNFYQFMTPPSSQLSTSFMDVSLPYRHIKCESKRGREHSGYFYYIDGYKKRAGQARPL